MANSPRSRVIKTSENSKAGILLQDDAITFLGDRDHFIVVDSRGTTIKGPVSIATDAANVRTGGLFIGLNDLLTMIPSTVVTPIPQKIPFPPMYMATNIAIDCAFFLSLLI